MKTFKMVSRAMAFSQKNGKPSLAIWKCNYTICTAHCRLEAGAYRVVNSNGEIVAANSFYEICK